MTKKILDHKSLFHPRKVTDSCPHSLVVVQKNHCVILVYNNFFCHSCIHVDLPILPLRLESREKSGGVKGEPFSGSWRNRRCFRSSLLISETQTDRQINKQTDRQRHRKRQRQKQGEGERVWVDIHHSNTLWSRMLVEHNYGKSKCTLPVLDRSSVSAFNTRSGILWAQKLRPPSVENPQLTNIFFI